MREQPHSIAAEVSLLGSILLDSEVMDEVVGVVQRSDFFKEAHRYIWATIRLQYEAHEAIDVVTVGNRLAAADRLTKVGGLAYLGGLTSEVPTIANAARYAQIVRDKSLLRTSIQVASEIANAAYSANSASEHLAEAERRIMAVGERAISDDGVITIGHAAQTAWDRMMDAANSDGDSGFSGVKTGLSGVDRILTGLATKTVTVIGGRPAMGKTAFVGQIAMAAGEAGHTVAFFSLEMSAESLSVRMMCSKASVDSKVFLTGVLPAGRIPALVAAKRGLADLPIITIEDKRQTIHTIEARARRIKRKAGLGLIIVDYLQLIQPVDPRLPREQQVAKISRGLHVMAHELDCAVIVLAQLNRGVEQRADKRPMMSDLRESGAVEQDADVIMFLYRDEYYYEDSPDKGIAEVLIVKQRMGETGSVKLRFFPRYTRFNDLALEPDGRPF